MSELFDWLRDHLWAGWGMLGIALAVAELFTLDLTLLMLAAGALMGALTALVAPDLLWLQVIVALATAVATLFLLRPTLLQRVRRAPGYRSSLDKLVGSTGVALSAVRGDGGEVKVDGQTWAARLFDPEAPIEAGDGVEVYGLDGVTLIVYPARDSIAR